ncbi:MAG: ABC transporter substrate-binding protein [Bacteroidales bacterium]|nr:ABC transporter substrate-binding protein [Bacteroidales bacterium]
MIKKRLQNIFLLSHTYSSIVPARGDTKKFMRSGMLLSLIMIIGMSSCRQGSSDNELKIFRYNEAAGISSLDPAFARDLANIWACNQLFDGLVSLDEQLDVQPSVAEDWKISPDGKIYTFYLRKDVFFHDHMVFEEGKGRRVDAYDFEFSFRRILNPKLASPGFWVFNNVADDGFKALNDTVFQITLKHAFTPFLGLLTMQYCNVVPKEAVNTYGRDFRKNPVGCGPFQFQYWKEGVKLVFRKNPEYFLSDENGMSLPYLDAVAITFLIDKQSAFLQFMQGKLDFMSGIDASYKDELLTREGGLNPAYADRINLISEPYLNTEYLGIMIDTTAGISGSNPLTNRLVRQAISYGFDRKKMMRYLRNNIGIPGNAGIIPAGMPGHGGDRSYGYHYNPEMAAELLSKAGYPGGAGIPPITLTTSAEYLDLVKYIQHELMQTGFEMDITVSPPAAIKELKAQAKLPFFRASWIADYPDAENYLSLFYSGNFCPEGPNYTRFSNPAFDALYERSLQIVDHKQRYRLYQSMDSIIMQEAPVIILFYDEVLRFTGKNIAGLGSNPVNQLDLTKVIKNN